MKRSPFLAVAVTAFNAAVLVASSRPTPTPTPRPMSAYAGPMLDVTFSGMVVFRKNGGGFRVVLADRRGDEHQAYMRFRKNDVEPGGNTFPVVNTFPCDGDEYQWVRLTAHRLRITPAAAIADTGPLDATRVAGWLVHLSDLARGNSFNDDHYNQANPVPGKVAAQIDLTTGTLLPSVMDFVYYPVQWEFRDGNASPSPPVHICGTSGIRWLLRLTPDTRTITLEAPGNKHIILRVTPGQTTTIIVGNSREKDIECPKAPPRTIDDDFKMHYKMLRTPVPVGMQYVPVRVSPEVMCTPPVPVPTKASRSQRGSDCIGAQWP